MKIRVGIWQEIDLDELRNTLGDDDPFISEDMSDEQLIEYLYDRMIEDINTMVISNDLADVMNHEIIGAN